MKSSHILGLNARSYLYLSRYNKKAGKKISDSKLRSKKFLKKFNLPHPRMIIHFETRDQIANFDWNKLQDNFVVKPSSAYAGEGIMLIRKRISNFNPPAGGSNFKLSDSDVKFQLMDGSITTLADIKLHLLDILEGRFDKYDFPGAALIEERIVKHPLFKKYAYKGTPDIRIIVFNRVPVLSMLRLPTKESKGRANRSQGAVCVGIDMATGITTRAVQWDRPIRRVAEYPKLKFNGLRIPWWDDMLKIAVEAQEHIALKYLAVDFLLDPVKGPLIVELTARPGLSIQLANGVGLRRRLERVEGLDVSPGRGIEVAKALFAEDFSDKVIAERGVKTVNVFETIQVRDAQKEKYDVPAKLDTGAFRTSLDRTLAENLGLLTPRNILWTTHFESALGQERRPVIPVTFWLAGRKVETTASVADRSKMKCKILVGRRDLGSFVIKPKEESI